MKRLWLLLLFVALGAGSALRPADAQTCSIGGHNETSENFAAGGWTTAAATPGVAVGAPTAPHLLISEVAPRGFGTGAGSDSSEYIEIFNPTSRPASLADKYLSDDISYYRVVNGAYPAANVSDYAFRFPTGLVLSPGRTLIVCVSKVGFAACGATPGPAEHFLEMRDSNGNPADDMTLITTVTSIPLSGGMMTNPSATNGEWVVLFCWNGVSDNVCDLDYASWGANSAGNPKMNKTGVSIDGPDGDGLASAFNADTAPAGQTNLGTVLNKPNTWQRVAGEVGELSPGGNGCVGRIAPTLIAWTPVAGTASIRFQTRWTNLDHEAMSTEANTSMMSQEFGVFLPDYGSIGSFPVPPLQPDSFFDVFFDVPLSSLPPPPQKFLPGGGPGAPGTIRPAGFGDGFAATDCPPDTNWAGNVDIFWSGPGQGGQVNKHYGDLLTCRGGPPSYIHFRPSNCTTAMPWTLTGVCAGYSVTLVNEDFTPAPNPVPVGWSGWICVSANASVPTGTSCCFGVVFACAGQTSTIDICSTACDWQNPNPPTLSTVDWTPIAGAPVIRFHQRWTNSHATLPTDPISGDMSSQEFGVFQPDFGPIGSFAVPPIQPSSFFDVFFDVPLSSLPPEPQKILPGGGPGAPGALSPLGSGDVIQTTDCPPDTNWAGNVDIVWTGAGGGQVNRHYADLRTCRGGPPSYIHFRGSNCSMPMPWSVVGLCPGFSATLVNEDFTPAPNPVPVGWSGWICVTSAAAIPSGSSCCFGIVFTCGTQTSTIEICSTACDWQTTNPPTLSVVDWTTIGTIERFHLRWVNDHPALPSDPVGGEMRSQPFGVFVPSAGLIGGFNVPPIQPSSFFDVFFDIPIAQLPPEPVQQLPGGGPPPTGPCPPPTAWHGNVDVTWSGPNGVGQVNRHFGELPVCPGADPSYIHLITGCPSTVGAQWTIAGLCSGFHATLVNEDYTPAPNPVPPGWTGWICVRADAGVTDGTSCCFQVNFLCGTAPGSIEVCAYACNWSVSSVPPTPPGMTFGIYLATPNPTSQGMSIGFVVPADGPARLDLFNIHGQRVRSIFDGSAKAGPNVLSWDGRGDTGRDLAPGAYFLTLKAGGKAASRKILLTR